tara:strand:+ start:19700 stop:20515 length:816 start_codon:yes stop_codon:yes gene_type:complete
LEKEFFDNSAIILSSTFGEDEAFILNFLKHVSKQCFLVKDKFLIIPVLVFEKSENHKKLSIEKKLIEEKLPVSPILITNFDGKGFSSCLNLGIKKTNSEYIFRLDTDDRTNSQRLINQIMILKTKNIDLCAGYMEDNDSNLLRYPSSNKSIALMTAIGTNPIAHPTVCIRRESLFCLYDESLSKCEDMDLWLRLFLSNSLRVKVLKKPLTKYDIARSFSKDKENALTQIKIRLKYIKKLFLILLILFFGLFPNILRFLFIKNAFLFLRRKI